MKAHYRTANGRLTFEVQAETVKALFTEVAKIQEVFDAESTCGCCKSHDIRFQHRQVEEFDYYELRCNSCSARFQFGQSKKGGALFPKRKAENGNYLDNRGWSKFKSDKESKAVGAHVRDEDVDFDPGPER